MALNSHLQLHRAWSCNSWINGSQWEHHQMRVRSNVFVFRWSSIRFLNSLHELDHLLHHMQLDRVLTLVVLAPLFSANKTEALGAPI